MGIRKVGQWLAPAVLLFETIVPQPALAASVVRNERDWFGRIALRRDAAKPPKLTQGEPIEVWSTAANDAMAVDHTPVAPGENRVFGEQLGPARSARAMAIVHIAMFEALNAIDHQYASYTGITPIAANLAVDSRAAVAQAAYDTMAYLYPSQKARFDTILSEYLSKTPRRPAILRGINLGHTCALSIINRRTNDGSGHTEPVIGVDYQPGTAPGDWQQDPISQSPIALGAFWGRVKPFVLSSSSQFRVPPPPALTSADYTTAFDEVFRLGGNGAVGGSPTQRTAEQTIIGKFWGYDGTPQLGTPPRFYNQIALVIAKQMGTTGIELARLMALINVALGDTGIATWESKYVYEFWRPITAIRNALGDGNPNTTGDPNFIPLGAPASNTNGPDFTPPFPAYPSGHAAFGGALFQILRGFYGTDAIAFSVVSDEFNGITKDSDGTTRPRLSRSFGSLSQAEEENGQSRIYLGIHWSFDKTEGVIQGRSVADEVLRTTFLPAP